MVEWNSFGIFWLCTQGTYQFMSDDILEAAEGGSDYLQSPIDELFSFYYTMQWAALFHEQEIGANDIPIKLKRLREKFLENNRLSGTTEIINKITLWTPRHEYGPFLASCQPVLRAWYLELQDLSRLWRDCEYELNGQEMKAEIYLPLFLTFAVRGVAILAELVHEHTKNMDYYGINRYSFVLFLLIYKHLLCDQDIGTLYLRLSIATAL